MMDDLWLIRENIARYRRLIEFEADATKRAVLERLLAECVANLHRGETRLPTASSVSQAHAGSDTGLPVHLADKT
jgi:hypothetical protein